MQRRNRRAKIVATVGPASASPTMLRRLFLAGVDVFRLNFSHGVHEDHAAVHKAIRDLEADVGRPIGILQDLQGPKIRIGTLKDGAIVGVQDPPGQGGFLTTYRTYRDFEVELEARIDWPFDSGVFLRVGPTGKSHQVTLDCRQGGEIGAIYIPWGPGFVHHCPGGIEHFKKDDWNKVKIRCQGEPARIQVWVNGTQVTDFQHTAETTKGVPAEGTLCLQIHPGGEGYDKSEARFRAIRITEL